jgi:hypothetical protein
MTRFIKKSIFNDYIMELYMSSRAKRSPLSDILSFVATLLAMTNCIIACFLRKVLEKPIIFYSWDVLYDSSGM